MDQVDINNMSREQLQAFAKQLQAQAKDKPKTITMKVSEKGGLSVYGLGRFPVTLYKDQWTRLLSKSSEISAFIEANQETLLSK